MSERRKEKDYYKTTDFTLVCCFQYFGQTIDLIEKNPDKKNSIFCILRSRELDKIIESYFKHELLVDPVAFSNIQKEIKTRLHGNTY